MTSLTNNVTENFDHIPKVSLCLRMLLNSKHQSDIEFTFKNSSVSLFGHKFIIGLRSSVFHAMFYGSLAEENEKCMIEDVSPTAFYEMLQFIYTDDVNINEKNFTEIMYAAHKYSLNCLEKLCCDYAIAKLDSENCCLYLQQSFLFDNDLSKKCLEVIDRDIRLIVQKSNWKELNADQMKTILESDFLDINEYNLFEAVMEWAKFACEKDGLDFQSMNIRDKFTVFELIRFPTMSLAEFSSFHQKNKYFLQPQEIADIFQYINAKIVSNSLKHSTVKRKPKNKKSSMVRQQQVTINKRITQ